MKQAEIRRDFLYSALSVCFAIIFVWKGYLSKVIKEQVVPYEIVVFSWLAELLKVLIISYCYPSSYFIGGSSNGGDSSRGRSNLPFFKNKEDGQPRSSGMSAVCAQVSHIANGMLNFVGSVGLCHCMCIFLGAPFIEKWENTFGFSCVLVTWLYFPLTLVIHPASVLMELAYISSWKSENASLTLSKWRFLCMLFGAWAGAVVIPLDWDRPWQKWPTPCLISSFLTFLLINCLYSCYFSWITLRQPSNSTKKSSTSRTRKAKNF